MLHPYPEATRTEEDRYHRDQPDCLVLGLLIMGAVGADILLNGGTALEFLARKFLDLIEWVAFWN